MARAQCGALAAPRPAPPPPPPHTCRAARQLCAQTDPSSAELLGCLHDAAGWLEEDPLALAKHDVFDPVYSVLLGFGEARAEVRELARQVAFAGLAGAVGAAKRSINALASDAELAERRSLLAMGAFLVGSLIQEAEKAEANPTPGRLTSQKSTGAAGRGRKGSKKTAAGAAEGMQREWEWEAQREPAALLLLEALSLNLAALWAHRTPDEPFLMLFSRSAFAILEQPAAVKGASGSLREALWELIALPALQHGQEESTVASVVALLVSHEHLVAPLAELMRHLIDVREAPSLVSVILGEVVTLQASEMGADSSGPKNVAGFLVALASRAPMMLLANRDFLNAVLTSEAYTIRCGVVSTYGQLQIEASRMEAPPPDVREACEGLLAVPLERLHDVSSFVRCRALQTLALVAEARALPADDFVRVAELGLGRLSDKNANARRAALQLYCRLLEFNPFSPTLSREGLAARREGL